MEEPLVAVTSHVIEDASLIVVHVRRRPDADRAAHCAALGDRLRELVDRVPEASVVILHGDRTAEGHEPTQAMLAEVARRALARGVFVRCA